MPRAGLVGYAQQLDWTAIDALLLEHEPGLSAPPVLAFRPRFRTSMCRPKESQRHNHNMLYAAALTGFPTKKYVCASADQGDSFS